MKVLLQRVAQASVSVSGETVGRIGGAGYLALVGCRVGDAPEDADRLAVRTAALRTFEDENGRMNRSVVDCGGSILAISQFTLYADTRKGNRPSFVEAGDPEEARVLYERYCADLRSLLGPERISTGRFGADMSICATLDGPCTISLVSETATAPAGSPRPVIPPPSISLRPVDSPETEALARKIAEEAWPSTYAGIIPPAQIPYMIERMYSPEAIREDTAKGAPFFIVEADGTPAGVCSFDIGRRDGDGTAELHKIYLLRQYRGRGIGHRLLDEICDRLRAAGAGAVRLRVNKANARAQKAYRAAGFAKSASLCTDIGGGFVMDDFEYRKPLAAAPQTAAPASTTRTRHS